MNKVLLPFFHDFSQWAIIFFNAVFNLCVDRRDISHFNKPACSRSHALVLSRLA